MTVLHIFTLGISWVVKKLIEIDKIKIDFDNYKEVSNIQKDNIQKTVDRIETKFDDLILRLIK